jgi:hypothetical protein
LIKQLTEDLFSFSSDVSFMLYILVHEEYLPEDAFPRKLQQISHNI